MSLIVQPPARQLLRAKDLIDLRYRKPLDVPALARAAHLSQAHFSPEFRKAFGETPHQYLLTRRLERAAALLRNTDYSVSEIYFTVGLRSVGSFTSSFGRVYGCSPSAYRAAIRRPRIRSASRRACFSPTAAPVEQFWRRRPSERSLAWLPRRSYQSRRLTR